MIRSLCIVCLGCAGFLPCALSHAADADCIEWRTPKLDDALAAVDCLARQRSAFHAAAYLLAARRFGDSDIREPDVALRLAALYQELGLVGEAQVAAAANGLGRHSDDYDRFRLEQVRLWLRHDRPEEAERVLRQWRPAPASAWHGERQALLALSLMRQRSYAAAASVLEDKQGFPGRDLVSHYNHAVALVRQGHRGKGMALLDEIGLLGEDGTPFARAIRDRANLQLGWLWLREGKGGAARPVFRRISLHGPYSDAALLGAGWAELAPDARPQQASFDRTLRCPDMENPPPETRVALVYTRHSANCRPGRVYSFRMFYDFAYRPGMPGRQAYGTALKYWTELVARDTASPAVQEGLLAIAYAYREYGAYRQAAAAYRWALERYASEHRRLESLERALLAPDACPLKVIGRSPYRAYFPEQRAGRAFHRAASDIDNLQRVLAELADLQLAWDAADKTARIERLRQALAAGLAERRAAVRADLLAAVVSQRERLSVYQEQALLGLALLHDPQYPPELIGQGPETVDGGMSVVLGRRR